MCAVAVERWVDLVDPTPAELHAALPPTIHARALEQLLAPAPHYDEPRPRLADHGDYIFGVFLVAVAVPEQDRVFYQEVDLVLTRETLVTVRKTPGTGDPAFDPADARAACREGETPAAIAYHLVDEVAERYLDLVDDLTDEIEELEDHLDDWPPEKVRERIKRLRHDFLLVRKRLAPTRDAVRRVVDNRVELTGAQELFPREVELDFADAHDKLLRATEGIEFCRDLLAGVRDYHQAKIANDQNEVMKRLTAIASLLLLPTLVVGVYGQNFYIPELDWKYGYLWSLGLIVGLTIVQLVIFRRKRWI